MKMIKSFVKLMAVLCVGVILLVSLPLVSGAEAMQGKGTKESPFIVTTAEQFNEIRNNLKAHYKLGNTIDLSGFSNFEPIGTLAKPFTGSLSCGVDSNGYPLYAIKNLKMHIEPEGCTEVDFYPGYKEDGTSGWEAGLFGYSKNGTFKNIIILDADLFSGVRGCTKYVTYNGEQRYLGEALDDMGTGILLAMGEGVTVTGCGATGKVVTGSNHAGGLLGKIKNGKISNSYCYADVEADNGLYNWGSGGFLGSAESTTISSCFYSGTFYGGSTHAGAFAGSVYCEPNTANTIKNCWATGTVMTESSGCFLGTKVHTDGVTAGNTDVASWCYTVAKINGRTKAQTNKRVKNDNYVSDETGIFEKGFAVLTMAEMNAKFAENDAWVITDGQYPQLAKVYPVTDSSKYVPGAVVPEETPSTDSNNTTQNNTEVITGEEVESNINVNVNIGKDVVKLTKQEKTVVIALVGAAVLMFVATVTVIVLALVRLRKIDSFDDEDEGDNI